MGSETTVYASPSPHFTFRSSLKEAYKIDASSQAFRVGLIDSHLYNIIYLSHPTLFKPPSRSSLKEACAIDASSFAQRVLLNGAHIYDVGFLSLSLPILVHR